ncbi:MAG: ATP-binding protein [Pseudomonadota bacterium]
MNPSRADITERQIDFGLVLKCIRSLDPLGLTQQETRELETAQLQRIAAMAPGLSAMTIVSVAVPPLIYFGVNGFEGAAGIAPWMAVVILGALGLCVFIWPLRKLDTATQPDVLRRKRRQLHIVSAVALFCVGLVVVLGDPVPMGSSQDIFLLVYVTFIGMAAFACTVIASYSNPLISAGALLGLVVPFVVASVIKLPDYALPLVAFLLVYTACFWLLGLNAFQNFLQLEVNSLERRRQRDVISLLLGEFETQSSDWIWETDAEGRLTHVPAQMLQASGGAAQSGRRLFDLLSGDPAALRDAMDQGKAFRNLEVTLPGTAQDIHWRLSGTPRREEHGGYRGVGSDISSEVHANKAQREADRLVRSIVEASPTTFLVSRVEDGKVLYQPPASRDRFGDIVSTLEFFLDPQDRVTYLAALLPTGTLNEYPVRFKRQDGSIMQGLTSARVIEYRGEQVIISSTRDVTELRAMEAELEEQRAMARQNEKMSALGGLLAGVSHELSNPLSIIAGYTLMVREQVDDPELSKKVERIEEATDRCSRIVRTFLAMARQRPTAVEPCSINDVIEAAWDVAGGAVRGAGGTGVLQLTPALPDVQIDPDQVVQVFTNLILNAGQAMAEMRAQDRAAQLVIASVLDETASEITVTFHDNGPGIPADLTERIFEPFFTTKPVGAGTGIGLALSHRIIAAHGGRITVTSAPGDGACFAVHLPLPASAPASHPPSQGHVA